MKKHPEISISRLAKYDGLYGDRNTRPDADYVFSELLETRSPLFGWEIKPHVHPGLLQLFFVEQGEFYFFEAETKTHSCAPCILLIPSTALHGFTFNETVAGRILTITESYYDSLFSEMQAFSGRRTQIIRITQFNKPYPVEHLRFLIERIDQELALHEFGKQLMLRACLQQLFLLIHRLAENKVEQLKGINNPASRYYHEFLKLVRDTGGNANVTNLANTLAISPVHLNRICKQKSGKSASQFLQEYKIVEAKKYLTYTGNSVAEIAYILHFEYPNYFAKFFKKHTGLSPKAFRELRG